MKRKNLFGLTILVALLVNLAFAANAQMGTNMSIEPQIVWDLSLIPGTEFTLTVEVDYVERLWAYQFELGEALFAIPGWDSSILNLVSVEEGPFLESAGGTAKFYAGDIDNTQGTLTLSGAGLSPKRRFPTGGGVLAYLTFEVVGYGSTPIHFGGDSGLIDNRGNWVIRGTMTPWAFHDGFFCNVQGPELYMRTKGAHGGGVYPEWQVNLEGVEQTLYSRIASHGDEGAWIKVKFTVSSPEFGEQTFWSDEAWIDAKTGELPELHTFAVTCTPPGVAKYQMTGALYFKVAGMSGFAPYQLVVEGGGAGEGLARDAAEHYKVVEHM